MKCIHAPLIEKAFSYRVYEPQIRYQVGFKFWENRHIKWINDAYDKYRIQGVGGRNKKNECFVAYDPEMKVVMGLADCKVNMHLCDVQRIQEWIRKSIGRFGKYYNIKNKFSPFSTATLFKIK